MKIGIGHELVIVARQPASDDIYFTTKRTWTNDPSGAKLFIRASVAYRELKHTRLQGYRVSVEGIFNKAFGHEDQQ